MSLTSLATPMYPDYEPQPKRKKGRPKKGNLTKLIY